MRHPTQLLDVADKPVGHVNGRLRETAHEDSEIVVLAKALNDRLDEIENGLMQTKIISDQDSLNFPVRLNSKLSMLAAMLEGDDSEPTQQSQELFRELKKQVDDLLGRLAEVRKNEVRTLNAAVKKSKQPAIGA